MNTYIFIHGGESFTTDTEFQKFLATTLPDWNSEPFVIRDEKKKWKNEIAKKLTEEGHLVYMPTFPNPQNVKYEEWKVFFDGWIPLVLARHEAAQSEGMIVIGTSLGGCFLLKYFSEQDPKNSHFVIPRRDESVQESISSEQMLPAVSMTGTRIPINQIHLIASCIEAGDFTPPENYDLLKDLGNAVHIWHAEDDRVVPFSIATILEKELSQAQTHFFGSEKGYGHFHGVESFPELETVLFDK